MCYNIRQVPDELWFKIAAKYIEHNTVVYKKPEGKQYTLLNSVTVGEHTVQCNQDTKFLYSGNHNYESISSETVFWIKETQDNVYNIIDELYNMGSDWNK